VDIATPAHLVFLSEEGLALSSGQGVVEHLFGESDLYWLTSASGFRRAAMPGGTSWSANRFCPRPGGDLPGVSSSFGRL
jgi:hypothetical protein